MILTIKEQKNVQFKDLKELNKIIAKKHFSDCSTETCFIKKENGQVLFLDDNCEYGLTAKSSCYVTEFNLISSYIATGKLLIEVKMDDGKVENWLIMPDTTKEVKSV